MSNLTCAKCGQAVAEDESYISELGSVCALCNSDLEVDEITRKGWFSFENILVVALVSGNFVCTVDINDVLYGKLIVGAVALLGVAYTAFVAAKNPEEPKWLRFGRPGLLLLVALFNIIQFLMSLP